MAVLCIMLAVICLVDYCKMRIPNGMILLIFLYGLGYHYRDTGGQGAAEWLFNCTIVLLLTYPLFKIGTLGAGDVKLFAVTCGCLSRQDIACFLVISLLISAVVSIIKMCKEGYVAERFRYFCAYMRGVCKERCWQLYFTNATEAKKAGVCLSGPILCSVLLHAGGVY